MRSPRRHIGILAGLLALLTMTSGNLLKGQAVVDLYIQGEFFISGIEDTVYVRGNVIYDGFGPGKMNMITLSHLYLTGDFINNNPSDYPFYTDPNPLLKSRGTVVCDQGFSQTFGGFGKLNFHRLILNKVFHTQPVRLTNDMLITERLVMGTGDLNVDSSRVFFEDQDTASYILGENDTNRIYGSIGSLQTTRFASISAISPGRIGLTFSGLQGNVFVRRYFNSLPGVANGSIERNYEVRSTNSSVLSAAISSAYLDSTETNGHGDEFNFKLFRSKDNGANWVGLTSTVDTTNDLVSSSSMQGSTSDTLLYTIADENCSNPPADSLGADTSFCDGDSVLLNAGSGTGYTYLWSTGATSQMIWVSQSDTISVIVTDPSGCTGFDTVVVSKNSLPFVLLADTVSACPGVNASWNAQNPGSTFLWNTGFTGQILLLSHTDTLFGYDTVSVTVTDTNGCANSDQSIFRKYPAPSVNLGPDKSICGGSNVLLNALWNGPAGNVGVSYAWNTGATLPQITVGTTGAFWVTVTNAFTCTDKDTVQVNVAPALSASATGQNISCNGAADGAITLTVNGGTSPFTFAWSNGATTQNISGLAPGTYSVTVTDSLGCTANATQAIIQPSALLHTMTSVNVSCAGGNDGSGGINTLSGGTPPYSFLWSNGATSQTINSLATGVYTVTVTDSKGCSFSDSILITEPSPLSISLNSLTNPGCVGSGNGAIDISVAGGVLPYSYLWSNSATSQDISGVPAGTYSVLVTDGNTCQATDTFTLASPSSMVLTETHIDPLCNGGATGSIDLSLSGGAGPFSYQWSNGATTQDISGLLAGNYSVTVTDANNCSQVLSVVLNQPTPLLVNITTYNSTCGSANGAAAAAVSGGIPPYSFLWNPTSSTLDSIPGLAAGIYSVQVTDQNGCITNSAGAVSNNGAPVISVDSTRNISCNGSYDGYIEVSATGGSTPYTYAWSNGGNSSILNNVGVGTYNLTLTAGNGCQAFATVTLTQPTALSSAGILTHLSCNGDQTGAIDFIPSGGTTPYSYLWSNGATTQDVNGLSGGTYQISLSDANGCLLTNSFTVNEPSKITSSVVSTDVSCNGASDGSVDLTVSGGTPNYSFSWSNGQISEDITGLPAGNYVVTVTDNKGCVHKDTAQVSQPGALQLSLLAIDVNCNGGNDGSIDLTVSGGMPSYSFAWSNGATTEDLTGLGAGNFSVSVTDANGCQASSQTAINEPALLIIDSIYATDVHCGGNNSGTAGVTVSGGTSPYTYLWSNAGTTPLIQNLTAGNYSITVSDANGCTVNGQVVVIEPPTLSFSGVVTDVSCQGQSDGFVFVSPFGGSAPYTYAWSNGDTTQDLLGVPSGNYSLTLTDVFGCSVTNSFLVDEGDSALDARFLMATVVNSEDSVFFFELSVPIPSSVMWDFGDGSSSTQPYPVHVYADNPNEDTSYYEVKMIASNSWCTDSLTKIITVLNGNPKGGGGGAGPGSGGPIVEMTLFPNPNRGEFTLRVGFSEDRDGWASIYDLHGRQLNRFAFNGSRGFSHNYEMKNISRGVYLVKLTTGNYVKVLRLVIL